MAAGIAHALGRLHERGHLHGDVQPAHFMPPETAEGMRAGSQRIPLHVRAEVYALGAVIWFLCTASPRSGTARGRR
ncbi:hypothetical protein GBF35_12830 [Nonomuraea phyllanthi]|uniref:hypothetical protein n=1 Tax=Nonomuraea phyllanthi TaxID=2219224 RepID=UPI0012938167|nr:hypothetical protein [Nonomuraea phyllanthi]QFY07451.1 hypothetical protein GBF35_12830 [Nonomuraea phyllanthi]